MKKPKFFEVEKKELPITILIFLSIISTLIFSIVSLINGTDKTYSLISLTAFMMMLLLNGILELKYRKNKKMGYAFMFVAILNIITIIITITTL